MKHDPQFRHDCSECKFLGRYGYEGKPCDLYYCPKVYGSIVIRWSDRYSFDTTMQHRTNSTRDTYTMISARYHYMHTKERSYPVIEAFRRAINAGYVNHYVSSVKGGV
jgi:hypothetical protein